MPACPREIQGMPVLYAQNVGCSRVDRTCEEGRVRLRSSNTEDPPPAAEDRALRLDIDHGNPEVSARTQLLVGTTVIRSGAADPDKRLLSRGSARFFARPVRAPPPRSPSSRVLRPALWRVSGPPRGGAERRSAERAGPNHRSVRPSERGAERLLGWISQRGFATYGSIERVPTRRGWMP